MSAPVTVRPATADDVPELVAMIRELAEYERALHEVEATEEHLQRTLFGETPAVFAHVAEAGDEVVGMAIWFLNYSTWLGAHNLYLEDLYVRPGHRGLRHRTAAAADPRRGVPWSAATSAWSGGCWTGTRRAASTRRSAPRRSPSGSPTASTGDALARLAEPR